LGRWLFDMRATCPVQSKVCGLPRSAAGQIRRCAAAGSSR
jgi:hypothetical protein